jgi:hypothetical protein
MDEQINQTETKLFAFLIGMFSVLKQQEAGF